MTSAKPKGTSTIVALAALAVLLVAVNVIAGWALRSARIDLTEAGLYTLTDGSRNIVAGLEEPVTLKLYVTGNLAAAAPALQSYADRVRELLDEYVAASDGMLRLSVIDPEPFSEAEDEAVSAGLAAVPISAAGDVVYLGLTADNAVGDREVIPLLDPRREEFLEYELSRLFHELSSADRPVVAIMSGLPLHGHPPMPMPGAVGAEPWEVVRQIEQLFELRDVAPTAPTIDDDVDILMVVHPKDWPESALRAIDAFVMRGGKLLAFIDPHSEEDNPPPDPSNPLAGMMAPRASELERLLTHWGVSMPADSVAADIASALRVTTNTEGRPQAVDYVTWLGLGAAAMNTDDRVTADLDSLLMPTVGLLQPLPGAATTFEPLVSTSDQSAELPVARVQFMPDPKSLLQEYVPGGRPLVVAARLSGPVTSAFAAADAESADDADAEEGSRSAGATDPPTANLNAIIVADADLLADRWWVRVQNVFGMRVAMPTSDNANFVINALDNLAGSEDLISIRSRGTSQRPFERLDDLRRQAEQQYAAEEAELQARLDEANQRLTSLQESAGGGGAILTDEVRAEIERFQKERLETRKRLRDVRHQLNKDIEGLEARLKLVNVLVAPLVIVALLAAGAWVLARRRAEGHAAARAATRPERTVPAARGAS